MPLGPGAMLRSLDPDALFESLAPKARSARGASCLSICRLIDVEKRADCRGGGAGSCSRCCNAPVRGRRRRDPLGRWTFMVAAADVVVGLRRADPSRDGKASGRAFRRLGRWAGGKKSDRTRMEHDRGSFRKHSVLVGQARARAAEGRGGASTVLGYLLLLYQSPAECLVLVPFVPSMRWMSWLSCGADAGAAPKSSQDAAEANRAARHPLAAHAVALYQKLWEGGGEAEWVSSVTSGWLSCSASR